jgi:nucleotide-binding universal stress UspA family protein
MSQRQAGPRYYVLVTVGDREKLRLLLAVGCGLARAHDGAVPLLCITPDGAQPDWLLVPEPSTASAMEPCDDVSLNVLVRPGHNARATILATARARIPDLLLLGCRGLPSRGRYPLGGTLDPVVRYAPWDVAVLRADGSSRDSSGRDHPNVLGMYGGC